MCRRCNVLPTSPGHKHADVKLPGLRHPLAELFIETSDAQMPALRGRDSRGRLVAAVRAGTDASNAGVGEIGRLTVQAQQLSGSAPDFPGAQRGVHLRRGRRALRQRPLEGLPRRPTTTPRSPGWARRDDTEALRPSHDAGSPPSRPPAERQRLDTTRRRGRRLDTYALFRRGQHGAVLLTAPLDAP